MSRADGKGPRFVRYFGPLIEALKQLGGSGGPEEVRGLIASSLAISEEEQSEQLPSGTSRFDNQVAWARFYLTRAGLLESSRRGVWSLTEKGRATILSHTARTSRSEEADEQALGADSARRQDARALLKRSVRGQENGQ